MNTFLLNGVVTTFGAANLALFGLFDDEFTFQAIAGQPTFYVGGLTWITGQCINCENTSWNANSRSSVVVRHSDRGRRGLWTLAQEAQGCDERCLTAITA